MTTTLCLEPTVQSISARSSTMRTRTVPGQQTTSFEMRLTCISPDNTLVFKCQVTGHWWKERRTEVKLEAWLATSENPWHSLWACEKGIDMGETSLTEHEYHQYLRDFFLKCSIDLFFEGYVLTGTYEYDGQTWPVIALQEGPTIVLPESFESGPTLI